MRLTTLEGKSGIFSVHRPWGKGLCFGVTKRLPYGITSPSGPPMRTPNNHLPPLPPHSTLLCCLSPSLVSVKRVWNIETQRDFQKMLKIRSPPCPLPPSHRVSYRLQFRGWLGHSLHRITAQRLYGMLVPKVKANGTVRNLRSLWIFQRGSLKQKQMSCGLYWQNPWLTVVLISD